MCEPSTSHQEEAERTSAPANKPFICSVCKKSFRFETFFKKHEHNYHKSDPYTCTRCFHCFNGEQDFLAHRRKCPTLPPGRRLTRSMSHNTSVRVSLSLSIGSSEARSQMVRSRSSGNVPVSIPNRSGYVQNNRNEFVCLCEFTTTSAKELMTHQYWQHNTPLLYNCPECSDFFTSMYFLEQHRMSLHPNDVQCYLCFLNFTCLVDLESHLRLHESCESTSFECHSCDAVFLKKSQRTQHVKTCHTGTETVRQKVQQYFISEECPTNSVQTPKVFRHKDMIQIGVGRVDREPYVHLPKFGDAPIVVDKCKNMIYGRPPTSRR